MLLPMPKIRQNNMNPTHQQPKKNAAEKLDENGLPATPGKGAGTGPEAPGNVDKIRDILFGTQMRDYEKKFQTS